MVVVTDTMVHHAHPWMKRNIPDNAHAFVTDVTFRLRATQFAGADSRALLQKITTEDLSMPHFRFVRRARLTLGSHVRFCIRITYVGELGYELYIPAEQATHVYDRIVEAAGIRLGACRAQARLAVCVWRKVTVIMAMTSTTQMGPTRRGWALPSTSTSRVASLAGGRARQTRPRAPLTRRLVQVLVKDPQPLLYHAEVVHVWRRGWLRSSGILRPHLGGAVGLVMVEPKLPVDEAYLNSGTWKVDIAGTLYPASVSARPLYDPKNLRPRT